MEEDRVLQEAREKSGFRKASSEGREGKMPPSVSNGSVTLARLFQLPSLLIVTMYLGFLPRFYKLIKEKKIPDSGKK